MMRANDKDHPIAERLERLLPWANGNFSWWTLQKLSGNLYRFTASKFVIATEAHPPLRLDADSLPSLLIVLEAMPVPPSIGAD